MQYYAIASCSEQVCLASSDLIHTHLALAGMPFNCYYHHHYYYYYMYGLHWGSVRLALGTPDL